MVEWLPIPEDALRDGDATAERWVRVRELWPDSGTLSEATVTKLLEERIVVVHGHIDDAVAQRRVAELLFLEHLSREKPVTVFVHSPGGVVTAAAAIVDTIENIAPRVETVVPHWATGAATWIAGSGARGRRSMGADASVAFVPLGPAVGGLPEEIRRLETLMSTSLARYSGRTAQEILEAMARSLRLSAASAIGWGLIDRVLR